MQCECLQFSVILKLLSCISINEQQQNSRIPNVPVFAWQKPIILQVLIHLIWKYHEIDVTTSTLQRETNTCTFVPSTDYMQNFQILCKNENNCLMRLTVIVLKQALLLLLNMAIHGIHFDAWLHEILRLVFIFWSRLNNIEKKSSMTLYFLLK